MKRITKAVLVLTLTMAMWGLATFVMAAEPGDLDLSFNQDGKILRKVDDRFDQATGVAVMDNGKVVIAGTYIDVAAGGSNAFVMRFHRGGGPDQTFDGDGFATLVLPNDQSVNDLAVLPNGKVLVVGSSFNGTDEDVFAARFKNDGSLDGGYGPANTGFVTVDVASTDESAADVAMQGERPVIAGSQGSQVLVGRLTADGAPDGGFATGGFFSSDFPGDTDFANGVAITRRDKIVYVGGSGGPGNTVWVVGRLLPDGVPDNSFSDDGRRIVDFFGKDQIARGVTLRPRGKIVVCGNVERPTNNNELAVARLKRSGARDGNFGERGLVLVDLGSDDDDRAADCALQRNGKVVAVGRDDGEDGNMAAVRLRLHGNRDVNFGRRGVVRVSFPLSSQGNALDLAEGKLVIAGDADSVPQSGVDPSDADPAVARLHL